jgi:hypothetical protein
MMHKLVNTRINPKPLLPKTTTSPMTLSVAILAFHNSTEILKETLQKSRTSLPSSKFYVATSDQDKEIIALCKAVAIPCIEFTRDVIKKDNAQFNYAGIARATIAYIKNDMKVDQWILLTRPQVVLNSALADIDLLSLAKDSLYGCGLKSISNREELMAYTTPEQPSASEVRELVPNSAFLLAYSETPKFDAWSTDTLSCVSRYTAHFVAKYMIHLKLAYLGVIGQDDDSHVSVVRWGVKSSTKLRIEPVHAYATQQQEESARLQPKQSKEAEKPLDLQKNEHLSKGNEMSRQKKAQHGGEEKNLETAVKKQGASNRFFTVSTGEDDRSSAAVARSEIDSQQNVAKVSAPEDSLPAQPKPKSSIWSSQKLLE